MIFEQIVDLIGKSIFTLMLLFIVTSPVSTVICVLMAIPIYSGEVTILALHAATGIFISIGISIAAMITLMFPR